MAIDIQSLSIKKAHEHLIKGDFSVQELVTTYKDVIAEKNDDINAYLEVFDDADAQAQSAERILKENPESLLAGIPIAMKDNILIKGRKVSASSKILEGYIAPYDATVTTKLKKDGVVFLGRTNCDEFAMGGSTENSAFGVTKNPLNTEHVAGGSSGGSAAAVAMRGALGALGSDTGGSIRQPAGFCGIVGLKPTYGSVSRHGLIAMGSSLDVIGPMAQSVTDTEILFNAIKGPDAFDSTALPESVLKEACVVPQAGMRIGVPEELVAHEGVSESVRRAYQESIDRLKTLGHEIVPIVLPHSAYALATYYIIIPAESSTNLSRFDGIRYGIRLGGENGIDDYFKTRGEGFGAEVRRRILLGTYVLSAGYFDAFYKKATEVRRVISTDYKQAFKTVDAILMPTAPTEAFRIGEKVQDPFSMYIADIFTVSANLVGIPSISIPVPSKGLPIGMQFLAPAVHEPVLFALGKQFLGEV